MVSLGLIWSLIIGNVTWADESLPSPLSTTTIIDIAGNPVPVPAGGLYDRYRSNPPLSVIASEAPDIDLRWFETLTKTKVNMGFESYSPNFYYQNTRFTAIFTADLDRLRELMPKKVLEKVSPVAVWPGRGVVALTYERVYGKDQCIRQDGHQFNRGENRTEECKDQDSSERITQ